MPMKNPPHPGGFVLRQCIEPMGFDHHASCRRPRRHSHHAVRAGKRETRNFSRDGRPLLQGLRRQRRNLAHAASALRPCPVRADRIKLKRLEFA
jgi:hypothetical protein